MTSKRIRNLIISGILTLTASGSILASVVVPSASAATAAPASIHAVALVVPHTYYRG